MTKFRTYNPDGKWFNYFTIGEKWDNYTISAYNVACECKKKFEQFTGLLDKNGREIYEGDILDFGLIKGFVEFVGISFSLTRGDHGYILKPKDYSECEIIGNIHENPELLNA